MTRRTPLAALLTVAAVAALALSGCVPAAHPAAPVPSGLAWTLTQSAATNVTTAPDASHAARALVPVSGGTVSATAADGTAYTLTIPADALRVATEVTLTPVASVTGSPFGETADYGVEIGPDGTRLDGFATLAIAPATPIPAAQQLLYQYRGSGKDLRFALPTPGTAATAISISISTDHFSGYGTANTAPNKVQEEQRLGGSAAEAIESELDRRIQQQSQPRADGSRGAIDLNDLQPFLDLYRDYVVEPRIAHAGDSCAAGLVAVDAYDHFQKKLALLGAEPEPDERWHGLVTTAATTCVDQEYTYCTKEHLVYRILPLYVAMVRTLAQAGVDDEAVLDGMKKKVVGCLSFRLDFDSDAVLEGNAGWESSVSSSVDITFDPSAADAGTGKWRPQFHPASAALTNTSVTAQQAGWGDCTATATPTDGEFSFLGMDLLASGYDAQAVESGRQRVGQLDDVDLRFGTTVSGGSLKISCPSAVFQVPEVPGLWYVTFLQAHPDELVTSTTEAGVRFTGWEPGAAGDPVIAKRSWTATGDKVHESGTLTLTHTPK